MRVAVVVLLAGCWGDNLAAPSRDGGPLALSPDGHTIVPVDAAPSVDTPDEPPIAACTRCVAFVSNRDGAGNIYLADSDGSNVTLLTAGVAPAWRPDGQQIAFARTHDIYVINADGSGETMLHAGGAPSWSPDGSRIAYGDGRDIYTMNADGTNAALLISHDFTTPNAGCWGATWSGDGTRIAIACQEYDVFYGAYLVNAQGSPDPQQLYLRTPVDHIIYGLWYLDWAHSARIVFNVGGQLASALPDGTDVRTYGPGDTASWMPDDQHLVFTRGFWGTSTPVRIYRTGVYTDVRVIPSVYRPYEYSDTDPVWRPTT